MYMALNDVFRILETLYAALTCHFVQHYFVTNFADPFALQKIEWCVCASQFPPSVNI
jgi:hypothetical protein